MDHELVGELRNGRAITCHRRNGPAYKADTSRIGNVSHPNGLLASQDLMSDLFTYLAGSDV